MRRVLTPAVGAISLILYLSTMNRTVSFIDSGELSAVAVTLGIAHPTGYPLFTIIGRLVSLLPIPVEPVLLLNSWAALLTAASVSLFFRLSLALLESRRLFPPGDDTPDPPARMAELAAFVGSLLLGFSTTVWAQSVAVEVYSLHLLLLMLLLLTFVLGWEESGKILSPKLALFAFLLGLSLTNHMTTVLIIPVCLVVYLVRLGFTRDSMNIAFRLGMFFALGLSLSVFLIVRSSAGPPLDWGHPAEMERFIWHVSGKQYRSWIFSGFESAEKQLNYFVSGFPRQFQWTSIGLMLVGLWHLQRYRRAVLWFVAGLGITCIGYSINYDIHDIDSYFLLAYVAAAIFGVFGLLQLVTVLSTRINRWVAFGVMLLLPVIQCIQNRPAVDESGNFLVHDYTQSILQNVDTNAVILSYQWDYFVSPSYYFQHVLGQRRDVSIIDKELLRRSWYFIQLERSVPWLVERAKPKIDAFLRELYKFEHGLPYRADVIDARFNEMILELLRQSAKDRPVYVGPEIEPFLTVGFHRVPDGLLFRLSVAELSGKPFLPAVVYRPTSFDSRLARGIRFQYARMLTIHGVWLRSRGFPEEAKKAFTLALEVDPSFSPAREALGMGAN